MLQPLKEGILRKHTVPAQVQSDSSKSNKYNINAFQADLLVGGHFDWVTNLLVDVRVANLDAKSQIWDKPYKVFVAHEKTKKKNFLHLCLDQHIDFISF